MTNDTHRGPEIAATKVWTFRMVPEHHLNKAHIGPGIAATKVRMDKTS